jgi:hypothetical protein
MAVEETEAKVKFVGLDACWTKSNPDVGVIVSALVVADVAVSSHERQCEVSRGSRSSAVCFFAHTPVAAEAGSQTNRRGYSDRTSK